MIIPPQVKLIGILVFSLGLVYTGWYSHGMYTDHKLVKALEQVEKERKLRETSDRTLIKGLQADKQTLQDKYIWLGKELENGK